MRTMKLRRHTPPLPATRRESTAAHPPLLRCAHGSGPPRLRMEAPSTAMPAAPAVYAPRLGPAGSACVSLPDQFSRLRRLSFAALRIHSLRSGHGLPKGLPAQAGRYLAAARTPLRQMGCCIVALARGWWWGVGSARHRFCGRMGRQRATGDIWRRRGRHMPARS